VGDILHRAVAELNEEGTEAAAATLLVMVGSSLMPQRPPRGFEMIVDRPFVFLIRERQAGNILFIGSVVDPE
jgi:serpin B